MLGLDGPTSVIYHDDGSRTDFYGGGGTTSLGGVVFPTRTWESALPDPIYPADDPAPSVEWTDGGGAGSSVDEVDGGVITTMAPEWGDDAQTCGGDGWGDCATGSTPSQSSGDSWGGGTTGGGVSAPGGELLSGSGMNTRIAGLPWWLVVGLVLAILRQKRKG